ncbi:guanine deaminase [Cyphellophora europaea CBS 101466]|uniref:Guanine deaminase n=1 Tax=Cyphellophora europaea (strain CBS 101466) TaxID=1220924 RepID=W2S8I0_CYPE1|nr:guanine deaminase [Cyphellophora europaea CBS 101466]ETN45016.1 guanine deaminase [Cyphellophora europaea CBS 101466]
MARPLAFHGTVFHCLENAQTEVLRDCLLVVAGDGRIAHIRDGVARHALQDALEQVQLDEPPRLRILSRFEFLIPGFIDTHNHACQWAQRGLGGGLHILEWLEQVTFPNEAAFQDVEHARTVYTACVDGFIQQGVTMCSYYGSLHSEATKILADICVAKGQRALIGKCNMNRNAPEYYRDASAAESLQATKSVIEHVRAIDPTGHLIKPILTPRFAICCDDELLAGLGAIAEQNPDLPIQTHFNEARQEIDATLGLFPGFTDEADLYRHYGLLTPRTILAHCTLMTDEEIAKLRQAGSGVAHCPIANSTVGGGFMAAPVSKFLEAGIKVGLGTDNGGGFSSSILDAIRQAIIVSNARHLMTGEPPLSVWQCFYLATLGGAKVCSLDDTIGNFRVGKDFDGLLIKTQVPGGIMTMVQERDSLQTMMEKFLISGDDRNIAEVYVKGRRLKG